MHPKDGLFPGISGPVKYPINEFGFRGSSIPSGTIHKALAIGGSTTECLYLDQSETWVQLLEDQFGKQKPVWIGNFSKSGLHTGHHVQQLNWALQQPGLKDVSVVFLLTGFNDLIHFLGNDSSYLNATDSSLFHWAFTVSDDRNKPFYKRTGFSKAFSVLRSKSRQKNYEQDFSGEIYQRWKSYRQADRNKLDKLPSLDKALERFKRYVQQLQKIATTNGITLVFMTQPVLWSDPPVPEHESLFWLGKKGDFTDSTKGHYYTTRALAQGMQAFNETLRTSVKPDQGLLIDLERQLTRDLTVFYDDCHFNESGARQLAQFIYRFADSTQLWK